MTWGLNASKPIMETFNRLSGPNGLGRAPLSGHLFREEIMVGPPLVMTPEQQESFEKVRQQLIEEMPEEVEDLRPWMTRALQLAIELRRDSEARAAEIR